MFHCHRCILSILTRGLCSAGVPAGPGTPAAWRAGEEQEETRGGQQIYTGESGGDGEEQEWAGRPHQKVKDTHADVIGFESIQQIKQRLLLNYISNCGNFADSAYE